jgi:hypothetical protein
LGSDKTEKAYQHHSKCDEQRQPIWTLEIHVIMRIGLTKKAEPPPTCGVNRDSGTDNANGG